MRIGTWNAAGRWDDRHLALLENLDCDVLLLTEVSHRVEIQGAVRHVTKLDMAAKRSWAGIWSRRPMTPLADPHGASAMAEIDGLFFCSSILPWRSCGSREPWIGVNTHERTVEAVDAITTHSPTVWGGDWNHALSGREYAGSMAGRRHLVDALKKADLAAPTAQEPHQIAGLLSIDHIAVPTTWTTHVEHHSAVGLSDHDAYVVELEGH